MEYCFGCCRYIWYSEFEDHQADIFTSCIHIHIQSTWCGQEVIYTQSIRRKIESMRLYPSTTYHEYLLNMPPTIRAFPSQYARASLSGRSLGCGSGFKNKPNRYHSRKSWVYSLSKHRFHSGIVLQNTSRSSSARSYSGPKPFSAGLRENISMAR